MLSSLLIRPLSVLVLALPALASAQTSTLDKIKQSKELQDNLKNLSDEPAT
jgi:hypothetical protein